MCDEPTGERVYQGTPIAAPPTTSVDYAGTPSAPASSRLAALSRARFSSPRHRGQGLWDISCPCQRGTSEQGPGCTHGVPACGVDHMLAMTRTPASSAPCPSMCQRSTDAGFHGRKAGSLKRPQCQLDSGVSNGRRRRVRLQYQCVPQAVGLLSGRAECQPAANEERPTGTQLAARPEACRGGVG